MCVSRKIAKFVENFFFNNPIALYGRESPGKIRAPLAHSFQARFLPIISLRPLWALDANDPRVAKGGQGT